MYTNEPQHYGNLISTRISGATSYHHFDAVESTRQLTNATDHLTDTLIYEAWGGLVTRTGSTAIAFRWGGQVEYYYDLETDQLYLRARVLSNRGRFLSRDPLYERNVGIMHATGHFYGQPAATRFNLRHVIRRFEHPYVYARNNPLQYVDPSGHLSIKPLQSRLDNLDCGYSAWAEWDFELDADSPCNGYFVQQVDVRCTVNACVNCPNTSPVRPDFTFWEAWFVEKGKRLATIRDDGSKTFTDRSRGLAKTNKCGNRSSVGTVKFFCIEQTGDLGKFDDPNPASGWAVDAEYGTGDCLTDPGSLPTTDDPKLVNKFWGKAPVESAGRSFTLYYCCCDEIRNFVHADAHPR